MTSILNAATNIAAIASNGKSLKSFLQSINSLGVQVTNNFEVTIAGLTDVTFFVQEVNFGGVVNKFEELHYNGRSIPVLTYFDYDHQGSMKVINDGSGYIYSALQVFLVQTRNLSLDNGLTMIIKCLTGDDNYKGSVITLKSVRLEKLDGLSFQYSGGDASTFTVTFNYLDYTFVPGALAGVTGVVGAIDSLIS